MAEMDMSEEKYKEFLAAPPIKSGRSKDIFKLDDHRCIVRLKPNLRSYTFRRDENIDGTEVLRLDFFEMAAKLLIEEGVPCAYLGRISGDSYIAELCEDPPFETIVKNRATGSTSRLYPGLFEEGYKFRQPVIKFDYRIDPEDLPIADDYVRAVGFSVAALKKAARRVNSLLCSWLAPRELWDFCVVIGRNRRGDYTIISEISPDCMRLRTKDGLSLDKDLFRFGGGSDNIVAIWTELIASLR